MGPVTTYSGRTAVGWTMLGVGSLLTFTTVNLSRERGADPTDPQTWNAYAYVRNNPLALVDPLGLYTFDAEGNAVEDENGACYEGGFGGSVTVTAQAPPDVMPIFVSLPSLLSDTQQPMPTAPPPAVTEAGVGVARPFEPGNSRQGNK